MKLWKRFAVAAFVAFLYYFCQLGVNSVEISRYKYQWETCDCLAIILSIVLLAVLAVTVDAVLRWSKISLLRRLFNHFFLVVFAGGVLSIVNYLLPHTNLILMTWMVVMFFVGYSFAQPNMHLDRYAAKICFILSPSVLIVLVLMPFWSSWPNQRGALPPVVHSSAKKTPVFFFVFDEWSFPRISRHGEIDSSFENIHKIASQSILFTNARSPASETVQSLPDILFQTEKPFTVTGHKACFKDGDKLIPTEEIPSIFQAAHQHDYRTSLLGFFHSYRQLLGDSVDYCNIYPFFLSRPSNGFWKTFLWRLQWTCKNNKDPISLQYDFLKRIYSRQWFETGTAYRTEMLDILAKSTSNNFAFFHAPWPHQPFVFNPDGSYFGPDWDDSRPEDYLREMRFLDNLVGEIVKTLQAANNYDDAILIMTSDHSWRKDFDPEIRKLPHWDQRVPLIIKLPGEKSGHVIQEEFSSIRLKPFFEAVFSGEKDPQALLQILEANGAAKN